MNCLTIFALFFVTGVQAFAPLHPVAIRQQREVSTELTMIGGLLQGLLGKKDAEITDTVYFDVSIDGSPAGRIEMGLYGSTVPKVGCVASWKLSHIGSMWQTLI